MVAGILVVGQEEPVVDDLCSVKHISLFSNQLLPVGDSRTADVGRHDAAFRGSVVGKQVDGAALVVDRIILVVHVGSHLYKLGILNAQIAHEEIVAGTGTALIEEHHGFGIVDRYGVETLGVGRVMIEQHVL